MRQKVSLGLSNFCECTARVKLELTDFRAWISSATTKGDLISEVFHFGSNPKISRYIYKFGKFHCSIS